MMVHDDDTTPHAPAPAADPAAAWIARIDPPLADAAAAADGPLAGLRFAVKDNIDVAGWPTTAACPEFAYDAATHATVVARLLAAGAVLVGKTNLDQFATGLNGTRTPYATPRSVYGQDLISGGSSSGSALAVALGHDLVVEHARARRARPRRRGARGAQRRRPPPARRAPCPGHLPGSRRPAG